jgi:hypothetical protein
MGNRAREKETLYSEYAVATRIGAAGAFDDPIRLTTYGAGGDTHLTIRSITVITD